MSVFDRLAPLIPQVSASCRQTKEHPKVCLSPPLSLSSPVIKKKVIQIPSFDERGLISEKHNTKLSAADRSFASVCSSQSSWSKTCQQRNHGERASTLPRTKPKTFSSQSLSAKPGISISPSPEPNSSPTLKPRPSDSLHLPASQWSDPSSLNQPEAKLRVSPTLIVPTPRLSPSPTSQCQGMCSDDQGGRQPSPVARERRARSIPISNPSNVVKHDVLDQEVLLDFTHPELRRVRHHPRSESHRLTATSPCLMQRKHGILKEENNTAIPTPKSNIKQQQQRGETGTQTSASECDGIKSVNRESHSASPQRKSAESPQRRRAAQKMSTESPLTRFVLSPNMDERRRRFDEDIRVETNFLSGSLCRRAQEQHKVHAHAFQNIKRFSSKFQSETPLKDGKTAVNQSEGASKDHSCQSVDIDQNREASQCVHRSNRLKTCPVMPQALEASQPASVDCNIDHVHNRSHTEVNVSDAALNQTPPDHHCDVPTKLLENPSEKYVASWPSSVSHSNTNRFGISFQEVFDLPSQHRVHQRPEETAAPPAKNYTAFITEDSEDPYYVTMYYPGSVYVDMSDIVPPEVRPKPAVPAKPPNVGAHSPSSPFPPQGPGIGGSNISAPPPSAIPVPIGSHGPSHPVSHLVGHNVIHGVGHAGSHAATHSGGHGHSGSHSSTGGSTLLGYIGIDTIIEQMRKKTMKTGFDFNIMVVGHSGLGKSTLVNTLFKSQVSRRSAGWGRDEKIPKTVEIKSVSHVIEEGGVKMKLTVVDTPGFGDQINNDNCWEPISKYINEQFEKFLKEEVNITRKKRIPDTRVHCCLYFISPTGHSLRQLDVEFMKRLSHSVNIIPVIAKADTMTIEERQEFKQRVRKELEMGGIEFYPQKEFDDDMEDKSDNDKIRETMPFAVVGSDKEYQVNGKRVLGRKTAWGIVEVENPNHCEFAQLRDFLIRSHLQDLKEVTHNIHYETYRAKRLNENGGLHPISSNDTQESNL